MRLLRVSVLGLATALLACGGSPPAGDEPLERAFRAEGQDPQQATGQRIFAQRCATCHGEQGRGDGQNAYSTDPMPPDFSESLSALSPEQLRQIVVGGTASIGRSPICPPWGHSLNEREIDAVVAYLQLLGT